MEKPVSVESLRPVAVLYEGDLYALACLLLKLWDARDREVNARNPRSVVRSRPTVSGLAMYYSMLVSDVSRERVQEVLLSHGLPLGAVVDNDDRSREVALSGLRQTAGTSRRGGKRRRPGREEDSP